MGPGVTESGHFGEFFDGLERFDVHRRIREVCRKHGGALGETAAFALIDEFRTNDIMEFGLHEYLMEFLECISELGADISQAFLVPTYKPSTDRAQSMQQQQRFAVPVRATDSLR